jgi:hypothetical protein
MSAGAPEIADGTQINVGYLFLSGVTLIIADRLCLSLVSFN